MPLDNSGTVRNTRSDKAPLHSKHYRTQINELRLMCCFLMLLVLGMAACSPSNQTDFSAPFELSSFLKTHVREFPGETVKFQILDKRGEPIAHALLRFEWVEGGRMDFQTDPTGSISMQFEKDMLENEMMVSTKSEGAKIRVVW